MAEIVEDSPSSWSILREALRGTEQDLTAIPIRRAVVLLAVPTILEMSMESLLTIVDIFVVSKLGPAAVATVGLTESMLAPIYAIAMGLSAGATAMIARKTGEKDARGAAIAAVQVIAVAVACSALFGVVGAALAPRLLGSMGATDDVVAIGSRYTALMLGGSITIFLLFVINAIFRAVGSAAIAMRSLWLANILNMILAPCLVFGVGPFPRLGVIGAAVAMTLGRAIGVAYQGLLLLRGTARLRILKEHLAIAWPVVRALVTIGLPAAMQVLIETASWLGLVRIISSYGSLAVAGYTIAMRIAIFALLPPWGLASAAATLVGQNLGANEPERARRSVWTIVAYNLAFLVPVGIAFVLVPRTAIGFFTDDPTTTAYAADCLRIVALGFIVFAFGMVVIQAFNGAGNTRTPMLVNVLAFWIIKLPLAWILAKVLGLGPHGVFIAVTIAYAFQATLSGILFVRGSWAKPSPARTNGAERT